MSEFTLAEDQEVEENPQWSIHTDKSSNRQTGEADVVLYTPKRDKVECMIRLDFPTTNNEVEYKALIAGLDLTKAAGVECMVVYYDSQVVINQVHGDNECKNERMKKYLEQVRDQVNGLEVKFVQIPREENEHADYLAKAASAKHAYPQSGTTLCSNITINRRHQCVGNRS